MRNPTAIYDNHLKYIFDTSLIAWLRMDWFFENLKNIVAYIWYGQKNMNAKNV
jgi:hypothetical protein